MGFAIPDRPREVRMEAAYFLQQLCQSRYRVVSLCYYCFFSSLSLSLFLMGFRIHFGGFFSLQLLDIANVHSLPWNTCFGGISRG
jgi:hypothetical protein